MHHFLAATRNSQSISASVVGVLLAAIACGPIVVSDRAPSDDNADEPADGATAEDGPGYRGPTDQWSIPREECALSFGPGQPVTRLRPPSDYMPTLRAADLNGDGLLDWLMVNEGSLVALFQEEDGTFPSFADQSLPFETNVGDLQAAHLNDDAHLDVVIADPYSRTVAVFLADGGRRFLHRESHATAQGPVELKLVDIDKDGPIDILVLNSESSNIQLFSGNGDGSFSPGKTWSVNLYPTSLVVGDWNQDGVLDLAVASYSQGTVSLLIGKDGRDFDVSREFEAGYNTHIVDVADMNADGLLDLVIENGGTPSDTPRTGVAFGKGNGAFEDLTWEEGYTPRTLVDTNDDGIADSWFDHPPLNYGYLFNVADWNADGILDFSVVDGSHMHGHVVHGLPEGGFSGEVTSHIERPEGGIVDSDRGDVTGDGLPDLVFASSDQVIVLAGLGDGTFAPGGEYEVGGDLRRVKAVELTQDPGLELTVVGGDDHPMMTILVREGNTLTKRSEYEFVGIVSGWAAGDLDGDGNPDLVVGMGGEEPKTVALLGNGDGTFQPPGAPVATLPSSPVLLDFDRDGTLDLIIQSGDVYVSLGRGDGTFNLPKKIYDGEIILVDDLNKDGLWDVVLALPDTRYTYLTIAIALGQEGGSFSDRYILGTVDMDNFSASVRDFDSDGHLDLQAGNLLLKGVGDGTFTCQTHRAFQGAHIVDVNGDGYYDVLRYDSLPDTELLSVYWGKP